MLQLCCNWTSTCCNSKGGRFGVSPTPTGATSSSDVPFDGREGGGTLMHDETSGDDVSGTNLYAALEVEPTCPMKEVQDAYRRRVEGLE